MSKWFFKFLACLVQEKNKYKVYVCFFLKLLIILKIVPKPHQVSQVYIHWPTILSITGGFQNNFQSHRRLPRKPEQAPWRGLLEGFSQLSKWFHRSKQKLQFRFSSQNDSQNLKTVNAHSKSTFWIFRTLRQIFISWHCSLNQWQ